MNTKKLIRIKDLDKWGACKRHPGEAYCDKNLKADLKGRKGWTPLEIARKKQIPIEDKLWLLLRVDVLGEKNLRLLAADYAEHVLHIYEDEYPDDDRPRKAIQAARDYANGKISKDDLKMARDAAGAAGYAAGAAGYAAGAARYAAGAAMCGAEIKEQEWQLKQLIKYLKKL